MLEVLQFVFSSFWVWLGTLMLIGAASNGVARVYRGARGWKDDD